MAGKARRAAARQGELSRRRKRNQRGPSGIPTPPRSQQQDGSPPVAAGAAAEYEAPANEVQAARTAVATAAPPAGRSTPQPVAQPRGQGRLRGERPAAYNYVGSELRRIAVLSTAVLAALVVLSFVI